MAKARKAYSPRIRDATALRIGNPKHAPDMPRNSKFSSEHTHPHIVLAQLTGRIDDLVEPRWPRKARPSLLSAIKLISVSYFTVFVPYRFSVPIIVIIAYVVARPYEAHQMEVDPEVDTDVAALRRARARAQQDE